MGIPSGPGFVPVGDLTQFAAAATPPRATTSQARHHFTTLRQVDQLIEASEADSDLGFMARLLALCSLPRTNPGDQKEFERRNGPFTLGMVAGLGNKLPFGTIPRLLLAWVCTEAVRTQNRELLLGRSLYEFMRKLGMDDRSGSVRGDRTRLKNQMRRLFGCTVTLVYEDAQREARVSSFIADRAEYWWDAKQPDALSLWESKIELGEKFFNEIIARPVPLDLNTLRADRPDAAPTDRVVELSPLPIQRRFTAAARAAGIEARVTAHSGRVGLAAELTARGASTTEVMLAGNWKTARMVAHYSAGATAERGAVRKYL